MRVNNVDMKYFITILFTLLLSSQAFANDTYLFAPIASYHVDRESGECEFNPGLQYKQHWDDNKFWTVGAFRNSPCNFSVTAMVGWESYEKKRFLGVPYGYGAMVGLSSGYDTPVTGAPFIRIGDRDSKLSAMFLVLPHPTKGVYGLGVSYKLK